MLKSIHGIAAGSIVTPPYAATGAYLSGSNDWYRAPTGTASGADTKVGIESFWIYPVSVTSTYVHTSSASLTSARNTTRYLANGQLAVSRYNSAITTIFSLTTGTGVISAGSWHHVLLSYDLTNASNRSLYINNATVPSASWTTYTNDIVSYTTTTNRSVGAAFSGGNAMDGIVSEYYLNTDTYLDLSLQANRDKFSVIDGIYRKPIDLGGTGNLPTGTQPTVYLNNPFGTFGTNKGSGVDLSQTQGTPADGGVVVRHVA